MTPTKTPVIYLCRCDECSKIFENIDLVEIEGSPEYPGASTWKETVSPCCNSDYDEID